MDQLNKEVLKLWAESSEEQTLGRMPVLYPPLKTNRILFVGLNPSFNERGFKSALSGPDFKDIDVETFYAHPNSGIFDQSISNKIEENSKVHHSYFKKFRNIETHLGIQWEHIDLFFIRETSQKSMKKRVLEKGDDLNEFGRKQLDLSKRLIEKSKPRLIVVANALASQLFKNYFSPKFNEEKGCHYVDINGMSTPVFLTSMLTGQRALDNHSFERLKWHIKKVLN